MLKTIKKAFDPYPYSYKPANFSMIGFRVCIVFLLLLISGCAGRDYKRAENLNTIQAYDSLIEKHHDGEYVEKALDKIEFLIKKNSLTDGTDEGIKRYLSKYPSARFAFEARKRREEQIWQDVENKNTIGSYKFYLNKYPNGEHVGKARRGFKVITLISNLESDDEDVRDDAIDALSYLGHELTLDQVKMIIDLMRKGSKSWRKYLSRQGHCTWYEYKTSRHYAAKAILKMKSPHVNASVRSEANNVKAQGRYKRRVTDPGWVCY